MGGNTSFVNNWATSGGKEGHDRLCVVSWTTLEVSEEDNRQGSSEVRESAG